MYTKKIYLHKSIVTSFSHLPSCALRKMRKKLQKIVSNQLVWIQISTDVVIQRRALNTKLIDQYPFLTFHNMNENFREKKSSIAPSLPWLVWMNFPEMEFFCCIVIQEMPNCTSRLHFITTFVNPPLRMSYMSPC